VRVEDMVFICDHAYRSVEVRECEGAMLGAVSFRMNVPTVFQFLVRLLPLAHLPPHGSQLALFLAERMLQEYAMLHYKPSAVAAAAVSMALRTASGGVEAWNSDLYQASGYTPAMLQTVTLVMETVLQQRAAGSPLRELCAVRKKYFFSRTAQPCFAAVVALDGTLLHILPTPSPAAAAAAAAPPAPSPPPSAAAVPAGCGTPPPAAAAAGGGSGGGGASPGQVSTVAIMPVLAVPPPRPPPSS